MQILELLSLHNHMRQFPEINLSTCYLCLYHLDLCLLLALFLWRNLIEACLSFSSVQFTLSVMSSSLWPHGLQHTRLPCPSPTPRACSDSCPLSWWCHPAISSSVIPFSSCLQSFPASESFPMSHFFASGGQSLALQLQHLFVHWKFRTDFL